MKLFRIVDKGPDRIYRYKVEQRHKLLFFSYWDTGAELLCPKYTFETKEEALMAIAKAITIEKKDII